VGVFSWSILVVERKRRLLQRSTYDDDGLDDHELKLVAHFGSGIERSIRGICGNRFEEAVFVVLG